MSSEWLHSSKKSGTAEDIGLCLLIGDRGFFYASNEPKSVFTRDLGERRDNEQNSQSVFCLVVTNSHRGNTIM